MKIRGKNFTATQRKILSNNGLSKEDINNHLLQKQKIVEPGSKAPSQSGIKDEWWTIVHRVSGKTIDILIEGR